jgi:hypothetical protein
MAHRGGEIDRLIARLGVLRAAAGGEHGRADTGQDPEKSAAAHACDPSPGWLMSNSVASFPVD